MRRIYESDAVVRDEHPHTPAPTSTEGRSTVDWAALSHAVLPERIRSRAVAVTVETDRETYRPGQPVGVRVTLRNRLPVPVTLRTRSPIRWQWAVDGVPGGSLLDHPTPDHRATLSFRRRERKTFVRHWYQTIPESADRWRPVEPGEHVITAWINVNEPVARRLHAETTVNIAQE